MIGGGPIGLEMAQAYLRLGAKVTVLEAVDFLAKDDPELSAVVVARLAEEGVDLRQHAKIARVERAGSDVSVVLNGGERLEGSHLLVAAGEQSAIEEARVPLDQDAAEIEHHNRAPGRPHRGVPQCLGGRLNVTSRSKATLFSTPSSGGMRKSSCSMLSVSS